jgi:hypothetical protein
MAIKLNFSRHSVINDHSKESNAFVKSRNNMAPSMLTFLNDLLRLEYRGVRLQL